MTSIVINNFIEKIEADGSGLNGYQKVIQFNFTDTEEKYNVAFLGDNAQIVGDDDQPACTVLVTSDNFEKLTTGKLNPQMAFMTGKIKVKGDMNQLLKLSSILQHYK